MHWDSKQALKVWWARALSCGCSLAPSTLMLWPPYFVLFIIFTIFIKLLHVESSLNIWNHPQVNSPLTIWQKHKQSVIKRRKIDMICFFAAIIVFAGCKHFLYVVSFCQEVSVVFQLNMSCVHGPNTLSNSLPKSEALLYLQPPAVSYKHKQTVLQTLTDFFSFH